MKQIYRLCLLGLMALACAGCAVGQPAVMTPTPAPTTAPTATPEPTEVPTPSPTPEPEGEPGVIRADGTGLLLTLLPRGGAVHVIGETDGWYAVVIDDVEALVEKRFVRLAADAAYEGWTGYAKANTPVYAAVYLEGDPVATLAVNTPLTVVDAAGDTLLIAWGDGTQGYTAAPNVSKSRIGTGGGSGGGGGGGSDGGDIPLSAGPVGGERAVRLAIRYEAEAAQTSEIPAPTFPCAGTVIADGTEAYLALYHRGDAVRVIDADEAAYRVLTDAGMGTIPRRLVRLASEGAYTEWDGYCDNRTPFYGDYRMNEELEQLDRNTEVHVLDDLGDCYLVETGGRSGYMAKKQVSEEKYAVPSGGGGGGGGGEWTEPVL